MKLNTSILTLLLASLFFSCSKDDDSSSTENKQPGIAKIEFDNAVNGDDLILESTYYSKSNDEKYSIDEVKYIVSNIVLIDNLGTEFVYPKDESYFIINEKNTPSMELDLTQIPAGTYTQIKFGFGVDQEKYLQGASGQGDLLVEAEQEEMMWAWQAGYRFLKLEGNFKVGNDNTETFYKYHVGSHGSTLDNYKEITLNLPIPAQVEKGKSPTIHIVANLSKVFDGVHTMTINDNPQIMVNPDLSPKVAENVSNMFMVHHVHNE